MSGSLRRLTAFLTVLVAVGLTGVLIWRIALVSRKASRGEVVKPKRRRGGRSSARGGNSAPAGEIKNVTLKYFDEKTGRLLLIVRAARGRTTGAVCHLEEVELERRLGSERGLLLASGKRGSYDRRTGSGSLTGSVLVRRVPEGGTDPDVTIRGESLNWTHNAETLNSEDHVEMSWRSPKRGRTLTARGRGLLAERWTQMVRLNKDVCVTLVGSALPAELDFARSPGRAPKPPPGKSAAGVQTIITCTGPGTFNYDDDFGRHRAHFQQEVVVRCRELKADGKTRRLDADDLVVFFRARAGSGSADGPVLSAMAAAAADPRLLPSTSRWLLASLAPPGGEPAPEPKKAEAEAGRTARVDLVIARGSVILRAPEGVARGQLAWYDHPAGILWLEGSETETAELVRGGEHRHQTLARRFFDVRTGDMRVPKGDRVTVTIEP